MFCMQKVQLISETSASTYRTYVCTFFKFLKLKKRFRSKILRTYGTVRRSIFMRRTQRASKMVDKLVIYNPVRYYRSNGNELKIRSIFDPIEFFLFALWKRFMNTFCNLFYLFYSKSTTLFIGNKLKNSKKVKNFPWSYETPKWHT